MYVTTELTNETGTEYSVVRQKDDWASAVNTATNYVWTKYEKPRKSQVEETWLHMPSRTFKVKLKKGQTLILENQVSAEGKNASMNLKIK